MTVTFFWQHNRFCAICSQYQAKNGSMRELPFDTTLLDDALAPPRDANSNTFEAATAERSSVGGESLAERMADRGILRHGEDLSSKLSEIPGVDWSSGQCATTIPDRGENDVPPLRGKSPCRGASLRDRLQRRSLGSNDAPPEPAPQVDVTKGPGHPPLRFCVIESLGSSVVPVSWCLFHPGICVSPLAYQNCGSGCGGAASARTHRSSMKRIRQNPLLRCQMMSSNWRFWTVRVVLDMMRSHLFNVLRMVCAHDQSGLGKDFHSSLSMCA